MQRIESKKTKIFDYEFYDNLLHWKIDKKLKDKYEREKEQEKERKNREEKDETRRVGKQFDNNATTIQSYTIKKENYRAKRKTTFYDAGKNKKSFKDNIKVSYPISRSPPVPFPARPFWPSWKRNRR